MDISGNALAAAEKIPSAASEKMTTIKPLPSIEPLDGSKNVESSKNEVKNRLKAVPVEQAPSKASDLTREDVEKMVEALEDFALTIQTKLDFSVNEETNDIVVKVMDKDSEKVIKQFPPEEILELMERMQNLSGFLFDTDA